MNIIIKRLLKTGFLLSTLFVFLSVYSQDKKTPTAEQFMKFVRTPPQKKTWAMLSGKVTNMKKNKKGKRIITKSPIYLGIRFTSEMIFAQVIIGKDEIYSVGQPYSVTKGIVSVIKDGDKKKNALKANFGIKPEDLTMSFIFWDLLKELPEESFGLVSCRVFLLKSPDKKETAKVYIGSDNYFPVKVEWSKPKDDKEFSDIVRSLEVKSFKEVNNLYLVDGLSFYGPGWRTEIVFPDCKAGYVKDGTPKDLFKSERKK
jgi:hypothetical protein